MAVWLPMADVSAVRHHLHGCCHGYAQRPTSVHIPNDPNATTRSRQDALRVCICKPAAPYAHNRQKLRTANSAIGAFGDETVCLFVLLFFFFFACIFCVLMLGNAIDVRNLIIRHFDNPVEREMFCSLTSNYIFIEQSHRVAILRLLG